MVDYDEDFNDISGAVRKSKAELRDYFTSNLGISAWQPRILTTTGNGIVPSTALLANRLFHAGFRKKIRIHINTEKVLYELEPALRELCRVHFTSRQLPDELAADCGVRRILGQDWAWTVRLVSMRSFDELNAESHAALRRRQGSADKLVEHAVDAYAKIRMKQNEAASKSKDEAVKRAERVSGSK